MFPQLEGVRFTHAWGGPIDQTATFLPFFRSLEPGNVHAGLGFSGHGLSQTMVGGRILASLVQGRRDRWTSMPVVGRESMTPPEPLRFPAVWLSSRALEVGDRRQDAAGVAQMRAPSGHVASAATPPKISDDGRCRDAAAGRRATACGAANVHRCDSRGLRTFRAALPSSASRP